MVCVFDTPDSHPLLIPGSVDRILRKQQAERKAAEEAAREKTQGTTLISSPSPDLPEPPTSLIDQPNTNHPVAPPNTGGVRSSLEQWKRKITGNRESAPLLPGGFPADPPPPVPSKSRPETPHDGITPWSSIGTYFLRT